MSMLPRKKLEGLCDGCFGPSRYCPFCGYHKDDCACIKYKAKTKQKEPVYPKGHEMCLCCLGAGRERSSNGYGQGYRYCKCLCCDGKGYTKKGKKCL